jgi:hypothetical protein
VKSTLERFFYTFHSITKQGNKKIATWSKKLMMQSKKATTTDSFYLHIKLK